MAVHREPGGLSTRELIAMLHRVEGRIVGADVVELNPTLDIRNRSAQVGAELVLSALGQRIL